MAIVDTLKLARALRDRGGFSQEAAEATAEAFAAGLGDEVATKADFDRLRAYIDAVKAELRADIRFLQCQIGIVWALQLAILVKLFVR
jgi:hypothetical protein